MTSSTTSQEAPRGFAAIGAVSGLIAGAVIYVITEHKDALGWETELTAPLGLFAVNFFVALLLLLRRGASVMSTLAALALATVLALPNAAMARAGETDFLDNFPPFFWFSIAGPIATYLLATLARSAIESGGKLDYERVFFHGLTIPLTLIGAWLIALFVLALLFAWAHLLSALGVDFFKELFSEFAFVAPFLGAISGLSIALMRAQEAALGALRFIVLLFARIATPILAVFLLTVLIVVAANGPDAALSGAYPGGRMLGLAFAGMLIVNGVYQNGQAPAPALWLRLSTLVALACFPFYTALAAYALWMRISELGLTPPRVLGIVCTGLAGAYSIVALAALVSEVRWRSPRWLPPVAPLNIAMAVLWIVTLIGVASPIINVWSMSARSQEKILLQGDTDAERFDYAYLRFNLGDPGKRVLERLTKEQSHPQAALIREKATLALSAESRRDLLPEKPRPQPAPVEETFVEPEGDDTVDNLEFFPDDFDAGAFEDEPDQNERAN